MRMRNPRTVEGDILYTYYWKDRLLSSIRSKNESLYKYLVNKKEIKYWKSEEYIKHTSIRLKKKEPVIIKALTRNILTMFPGIFFHDLTARLTSWQKVLLESMIKDRKESLIDKCIELNIPNYDYYLKLTRETVMLTSYGVVDVSVYRVPKRNFERFHVLNAAEVFFKSYKGLHKLSNFYIEGTSTLIDIIQFRNL